MGVPAAIGGAAILGAASGYFSGKQNASATQNAANAQAAAAVESARIYTEAAKEAAALAETAARTKRAEDVAAAKEAARLSEQYLMEAIPQMQAARQAGVDFTNAEFAAAYDTINKAYQPYIDTGRQADQRINALTLGTPEEARNALTLDPGYQFRLNQGEQSLQRSQVGKGNLLSGQAGVEMQQYGQGMASDEFTNAYNRLMGLSTRGQGALGTVSSNQLAMAGTRAQGAQSMAQLNEQSARDRANVRTAGTQNVLAAQMGGNQALFNAQTQGAQQGYGATVAGQQGIQNALTQGSNMNLQAQIDQNNVIPNAVTGLGRNYATYAGYNALANNNPYRSTYGPGSTQGNQNYAGGYVPSLETGSWDPITGIYTAG